jgi:hypothetical protein
MNIFLLIFIIASGLSVVIFFLLYLFKCVLFNEQNNDESIFSKKYLYTVTAEPITNQEIDLAEVRIIS